MKLPEDLLCERIVLATLAVDLEGGMPTALRYLAADCFVDVRHGAIYAAMAALERLQQPYTLAEVAVKSEVDTAFFLDAIDHKYWSGPANFAFYCKKLAFVAAQRKAAARVGALMAKLEDTSDPAARNELLAKIQALPVPKSNFGNQVSVAEELGAILSKETDKLRPEPVPTGLAELNAALNGGWMPGNLIVVGARPGVGKSAMALGFVDAAASGGHRVGLVSLEMTRPELLQRLVSRRAGFAINPHLSESKIAEAREVASAVHDLPIAYSTRFGLTIDQIAAWLRLEHQNEPLGLAVIDYLGRVRIDPKAKRNEAIGDVARRCKDLAGELGIPIILLSQLNREFDGSGTGRPRLSNLRDSGDIEQEADVILFPWRPEFGDTVHPEGYAELAVAKHRNGALRTLRLRWNGSAFAYLNSDDKELFDPKAKVIKPTEEKDAKEIKVDNRSKQAGALL